jgi:hypothetical protein
MTRLNKQHRLPLKLRMSGYRGEHDLVVLLPEYEVAPNPLTISSTSGDPPSLSVTISSDITDGAAVPLAWQRGRFQSELLWVGADLECTMLFFTKS